GRLHTKSNLMEELKKIRRVLQRDMPGAPHEILLVLDATTGQNAINQAKTFCEAAGVTGIVLTKLDGSSKGGVVIAVRQSLGIPVKFIGIGEGIDDLKEFDPHEFVDALFDA
ncbi:MAG: signal recognition particle-docking protein FtsY, partial [Peptococcaceae bacterium]|nr:signal recognition particle-docking protein FtsY [Peptococcaceae bacterium]